jgi:radial spoke head protein 1
MDGFGTIHNHVSGWSYTGTFKESLFSGHGTKLDPDGSKYIGNWLEGNKYGYGIFLDMTTKTFTEGTWENDLKHGE